MMLFDQQNSALAEMSEMSKYEQGVYFLIIEGPLSIILPQTPSQDIP